MLRKIKRIFKKKQYDYRKKFSSYESCDKYLKNLNLYLDATNIYHDKRFTKKFFEPKDVESIERFVPASLIAALDKNKKMNILDIGGGNNPIFSYIKKSTNKSSNCFVLETEKFSNIIRKKIPQKFKNSVLYIKNISEIKKKIDIVCFISSIQYIKDYKVIIKRLIQKKPKYFVITRSFFQNKKKNFYSIEHCVPGSIHPYIFFSFQNFNSFFKKNGYNLIFQNKYNENIFSHDSVNSKTFFHKDLIFRKR